MGIKTEQKEEDIQASSFYIDEAIFFASGGRGMTLKDIKSSIYKEKRCSIFLLRSLFVINLIFLPLMGFYYLLNPDKDYLFGLFFLALCVLFIIFFTFLLSKVKEGIEEEYNYIVSIPKQLPDPILDKIYKELESKNKKIERKYEISIEELIFLNDISSLKD
jgi:Ca2+/Na+ antiporter